jgi:site-specific DNA recombinase
MTDALYLRISRDRAGTELGVDRQREDCRQLATPGAREFIDNDTSASTGGPRPGYQALMQAVASGDVKRIIVWTTGRLWRNRKERAEGIETLKAAMAQVTPFKGPALDCSTAAGRALVGLLGELDSWETDTMTERLQREVQQRAEAGKPHGGPRAYGYTADGMALVPDEAAALARWYSEFLAGRSLSSIAREAGKTHATVRWILRNPRNAALRVHDGHEFPARWPAVVDVEVWRAADAILKDPGRRRNTRNVAKKWLGSGLFLCARCDGRPVMSAWTTQGKRIYKCMPSTGGCSRSWRADRLDEFITSAVAGRLRDPGLAALLPKPEHANELPDLYVERTALKSRLESLASTWALGELTDEQLRAATATAKARLENVETKISLATATDPVLELLREDEPAAVWLSIPDDQVERRQRIVRGLATVVLGASPAGRAPWSPGLVLGGSRWLGDSHTWASLYVDGRQ